MMYTETLQQIAATCDTLRIQAAEQLTEFPVFRQTSETARASKLIEVQTVISYHLNQAAKHARFAAEIAAEPAPKG